MKLGIRLKTTCKGCAAATIIHVKYESKCALGYEQRIIGNEVDFIGYVKPLEPCPKPTSQAKLRGLQESQEVDESKQTSLLEDQEVS